MVWHDYIYFLFIPLIQHSWEEAWTLRHVPALEKDEMRIMVQLSLIMPYRGIKGPKLYARTIQNKSKLSGLTVLTDSGGRTMIEQCFASALGQYTVPFLAAPTAVWTKCLYLCDKRDEAWQQTKYNKRWHSNEWQDWIFVCAWHQREAEKLEMTYNEWVVDLTDLQSSISQDLNHM